MNKLLLLSICIFAGCQMKKGKRIDINPGTPHLSIIQRSTHQPEPIKQTVIWKNYIWGLQNNGAITVRDLNLNPIDSLSNVLSKHKFYDVKKINDTLFFDGRTVTYYLDRELELRKYGGILPPIGTGPIYDDERYYIYGYGSITLFLNKKTGKTYGYPISNVSQVLKWNNQYYLSTNYKFYSDFYRLSCPDSLFPYEGFKTKADDWYKNAGDNEWKQPRELHALKRVLNPDTTVQFYNFIATFIYQSKLYTIYTTDSLTLLAGHENENLRIIDTIFRYPTIITPEVDQLDNIVLANYNNGLFLIKDNKIVCVQFKPL